jgi:hypothetical protein
MNISFQELQEYIKKNSEESSLSPILEEMIHCKDKYIAECGKKIFMQRIKQQIENDYAEWSWAQTTKRVLLRL